MPLILPLPAQSSCTPLCMVVYPTRTRTHALSLLQHNERNTHTHTHLCLLLHTQDMQAKHAAPNSKDSAACGVCTHMNQHRNQLRSAATLTATTQTRTHAMPLLPSVTPLLGHPDLAYMALLRTWPLHRHHMLPLLLLVLQPPPDAAAAAMSLAALFT